MNGNYIKADQYITLVAAAIQGLTQNPAIVNFTDPYQIQDVTIKCMQGVEQALQQAGLQIIPEKQSNE